MRRTILPILAAALVCAAAPAPPAGAALCSADVVPAATLLLPYFEVDLADPVGRTTLFSIANAADEAILAHVVLWTDMGVPTLAFDVYLTGFDIQSVNLRDLFAGDLPRTADDARDPDDEISPQGGSSKDVAFASCAGLLPPARPDAPLLDHLRRAHTGRSSPLFDDRCSGFRFEDQVARGYVTIDAARACSMLTPADPGYFGPEGVAADDNVLWGDFFYIDRANGFAQGENLVRLEAGALPAGARSFYSRFVDGSGIDRREPLPTTWAARFLETGTFDAGTDLIVWREPQGVQAPFPCNRFPDWFPLGAAQILPFDEEENPFFPEVFPIPIPPPPPQALDLFLLANRASVPAPGVSLPVAFGWLFLDLNLFSVNQAWVGQVMSAGGRFSVGFEATPLDDPCAPGAGDGFPGF